MKTAQQISDAIHSVRTSIIQAAQRAGRDPAGIQLVAVSKGMPAEAIEQAYACGQRLFGENYLQEALAKRAALSARCPAATYHFVGRIQRNKVRHLVGEFDLIHSVDRLEVAEEIDRQAAKKTVVQSVLYQVNISSEPSKAGFSPSELRSCIEKLSKFSHTKPRGLMAIGSLADADLERSRREFCALRELRDEFAGLFGGAFTELSMGMSDDFCCAVEEGSTLVRIGTTLFGPRMSPPISE